MTGEQHIRDLFQVLVDSEAWVHAFIHAYEWEWLVRCIDCLVAWHPSEGKTCWACGTQATESEYRRAQAHRRWDPQREDKGGST